MSLHWHGSAYNIASSASGNAGMPLALHGHAPAHLRSCLALPASTAPATAWHAGTASYISSAGPRALL